MKTKAVNLKPMTHRLAKMLAVEAGRRLNGDLIDDLVMFGIEHFRAIGGVRSASEVTCTGNVIDPVTQPEEEKPEEAKEEAGE